MDLDLDVEDAWRSFLCYASYDLFGVKKKRLPRQNNNRGFGSPSIHHFSYVIRDYCT